MLQNNFQSETLTKIYLKGSPLWLTFFVMVLGGIVQASASAVPETTSKVDPCEELAAMYRMVDKSFNSDQLNQLSESERLKACASEVAIFNKCLTDFRDLNICARTLKGSRVQQATPFSTLVDSLLKRGLHDQTQFTPLWNKVLDQVSAKTRQSRYSLFSSFTLEFVTFGKVLRPLFETVIALLAYNGSRFSLFVYLIYTAVALFMTDSTYLSVLFKAAPGFLIFLKFAKGTDWTNVIMLHFLMTWFHIIVLCFHDAFAVLLYFIFFVALTIFIMSHVLESKSPTRIVILYDFLFNMFFVLQESIYIYSSYVPSEFVKLITALLEVFAPTSSFTTINALSFSTEIIRTLFDLGVDRVKLVPLFALLLMTYVLIIIAFGSIFGSIFSSSPRNDFQQRLTVGMVSFYGYPENVITALRFAVQHALVIDFPGMILAFSTVSVYVYIIVFQFELFVIMFLFCRLYMPYHNVFDIVDKINAVTAPLSDSGCEPADVIEVNAIPDNHRQHPLVTQATETVAYERVDSDQKLDSTRNKFKNTLTSKIDTLTAGILPVFEPRQRVEWIGSSQLVQHQSVGLTEVPANIKGFVQKRVVVVATSFGRGMGLWISHNRLATATHVLSDAVTRTAISVNKVVYWFKSLFIYNASQNVLDAACVAQLLKEPAKADDAIEPCKVAVTGPLADITDKIGIHRPGQDNAQYYFYYGPNGPRIIPTIKFYGKLLLFDDESVVPGYSGSPVFAVSNQDVVRLCGTISCKFKDDKKLVGAIAFG